MKILLTYRTSEGNLHVFEFRRAYFEWFHFRGCSLKLNSNMIYWRFCTNQKMMKCMCVDMGHGSIYLDLFTIFLFQLYRDVGKDHHTS